MKYVVLAKDADYEGYFFLLNQTDLEMIKDTSNLYLFKNKREVAKLYEVDELSAIRDWEELLSISREEDITSKVHLL